jgi:acyl-CoA reductase-like NAD-dependent aldehyde dehydrogenase
VQDGVYDAFTKRLAETAGAMKVADGFEPGAVIGPLIDMKAVETVEAHIADAVKKGAKVVTGGKRAAQGGSFFEPVLTDVTTDMVITKEETFGPVAPLYRFKTEADAVKMANERPTLTLDKAISGSSDKFYHLLARTDRKAEQLAMATASPVSKVLAGFAATIPHPSGAHFGEHTVSDGDSETRI